MASRIARGIAGVQGARRAAVSRVRLAGGTTIACNMV